MHALCAVGCVLCPVLSDSLSASKSGFYTDGCDSKNKIQTTPPPKKKLINKNPTYNDTIHYHDQHLETELFILGKGHITIMPINLMQVIP